MMDTTNATMQPTSRGTDLGNGEHTAAHQELDKLEARRTRHDRDCQEEGELRRAGAAHAAEQAATMVAPLQDVPGMSASTCHAPMMIACL